MEAEKNRADQLVSEQTMINDVSYGNLPLSKAEQIAFQTMMAYFDPRYPNEEIPIDIRSIARASGKRLSYLREQFAKAAASLGETAFYKLDLTGNKKRKPNAICSFEVIPLYSRIRFDTDIDMMTGVFNDLLVPYFVASNATPICRLTMIYDFKSQYSFRLLAYVVRKYIGSGKENRFFVPIEELHAVVLSPKKEKGNESLFRTTNFNQSIVNPALRDINGHAKSPITVAVEPEYDIGRGGKKIVGYYIMVEEKEGQSIETYMDRIDLTADLVQRGFTNSLAAKITNEYSWNVIRRNLIYFDKNVKKTSKSKDQLGKILYTFIKEDTEKKERQAMQVVSPRQAVQAMPSLFDEPIDDTPPDLESPFMKEYRQLGGGKVIDEILKPLN